MRSGSWQKITKGKRIRIGGANGQDDDKPDDDGDHYFSNDDDLDEEEGKETQAEHNQKKGRKGSDREFQ